MEMISASDISNRLPEELKNLITISSLDLPDSFSGSVDALIEAVEIINGAVRFQKVIHVIIAKDPFKVNLNNGNLTYQYNGQQIHVTLENKIIFLDFEKSVSKKYEMQVTLFLEEFCHASMNIKDEALVSRIVSLLYEKISLNENNQYYVP